MRTGFMSPQSPFPTAQTYLLSVVSSQLPKNGPAQRAPDGKTAPPRSLSQEQRWEIWLVPGSHSLPVLPRAS